MPHSLGWTRNYTPLIFCNWTLASSPCPALTANPTLSPLFPAILTWYLSHMPTWVTAKIIIIVVTETSWLFIFHTEVQPGSHVPRCTTQPFSGPRSTTREPAKHPHPSLSPHTSLPRAPTRKCLSSDWKPFSPCGCAQDFCSLSWSYFSYQSCKCFMFSWQPRVWKHIARENCREFLFSAQPNPSVESVSPGPILWWIGVIRNGKHWEEKNVG